MENRCLYYAVGGREDGSQWDRTRHRNFVYSRCYYCPCAVAKIERQHMRHIPMQQEQKQIKKFQPK